MKNYISRVSPLQEFRDKPSKIFSFKTIRVCEHEKCTTRLSVYNPTLYCSVHERFNSSVSKLI